MNRCARVDAAQDASARRTVRGLEPMEPRLLLSVQPVHVGAVYIEEDLGSDLHGDSLLVTFQGGAPGTQLQRLEIRRRPERIRGSTWETCFLTPKRNWPDRS